MSDSNSNDERLELVASLNPYACTVILGVMKSKVGLYIEVMNFCQNPNGSRFSNYKSLLPAFSISLTIIILT